MNKFFIGAAALLAAGAISAQQIDLELTNFSFEDGTFSITNLSGVPLQTFELSISEEVSQDALILDDSHNPNEVATMSWGNPDNPVMPGETATIPIPVSWGRWMSHGMFAHVNNEALISIWSINGGVPWLYVGLEINGLSEYYYDGNFGNNFFVATGSVTENLVEISTTAEFIYVCGDTGVESAILILPQVAIMNDVIEFIYEGNIEQFEFTLYNSVGQEVAYTDDIDSYPTIFTTAGVYIYTMSCVVDGFTHTVSDNFYVSSN